MNQRRTVATDASLKTPYCKIQKDLSGSDQLNLCAVIYAIGMTELT